MEQHREDYREIAIKVLKAAMRYSAAHAGVTVVTQTEEAGKEYLESNEELLKALTEAKALFGIR